MNFIFAQKITSTNNVRTFFRNKTKKPSWRIEHHHPELLAQWENLKGKIDAASKAPDSANIKQLKNETKELAGNINAAGNATKSFGDRIAETSQRLSAYIVSLFSFQKIIGILRDAFQAIKDIDSSLVEIRKVSDLSGEGLKAMESFVLLMIFLLIWRKYSLL